MNVGLWQVRVALFALASLGVLPACEWRGKAKLDVDSIESIQYEFGGGELGADYRIVRIDRSGAVSYRHLAERFPNREKTVSLEIADRDVATLYSALIKSGLARLKHYQPMCCDISVSTITVITARESQTASYQGVDHQDPEWMATESVLREFVKRIEDAQM
ncbi:MAG: hypothetical protein WDZ30_00955 [Cellvibrionaceae bacterium]